LWRSCVHRKKENLIFELCLFVLILTLKVLLVVVVTVLTTRINPRLRRCLGQAVHWHTKVVCIAPTLGTAVTCWGRERGERARGVLLTNSVELSSGSLEVSEV
jgi:hypothetical protein